MKTRTILSLITLFAVIALLSIRASAQVTLYGLTTYGGDYMQGTIFSVTPSGDFKTFASLNPTFAANPDGSLLYASDHNFYATSMNGGYADSCTVFRCAPDGILTTMINLDSVWGSSAPTGNSLIQGKDGNLYGMTTSGGPYNGGVIFTLQLSGQYSALHFFDSAGGANPYGSLIQTPDGNLWGMTNKGGTYDSLQYDSLYYYMNNGDGTIFHCTTSGTFVSVFKFNDSTGTAPYGDLLLANDGNFYGLTSSGGRYSLGTLFRYTPSGQFTKLVDFNGTNGGSPYGSLIQGTDGNLYGLTSMMGDSVYDGGTLFSCSLSGNLTTLVNFDSATGMSPQGTLCQASDGNFYGIAPVGGQYGFGTVFQYSSSGGLKKLVDFSGETGYYSIYIYGSGLALGKLIEVDNLPAGLTELTHINGAGVYPNPNNGQFTLRLSGADYPELLEVYNSLGQKVFTSMLTSQTNNISITDQPNGIYFYRVISQAGEPINEGKLVLTK